ncbi:MAG: hypothetical protein ACK5Q5_04800 [Planctomycetaceae bacterium]
MAPFPGNYAPLNPNALAPGDVAALLSRTGIAAVSEAQVRDEVVAGAPTNPDGTLNLVHYAAWLVTEMSNRGD